MEATVLERKKATLNKGKLKKTIKNVICRPDHIYWPLVTEENWQILDSALHKYKVEIPVYNKPKWKELKLLPKENRPKAPKIAKVEGLLFGITECLNSVESGGCTAIILEATINPQTIVQPLIEACLREKVPLTTLNELRQKSSQYFGIKTSCLGVTRNYLEDISDIVLSIFKPPKEKVLVDYNLVDTNVPSEDTEMKTQEPEIPFTYLYRTNKKTRVFIPPIDDNQVVEAVKFTGQDFVQFNKKVTKAVKKNPYKKMKVKRIKSNSNRPKLKKQKK